MSNTPNWTGLWLIGTTYNAYDLASYQGSTWLSNVSGNTGNIPGQTSQWTLFAGAGQNGINAWRGDWASLTVYNAFDAVSYNNASYISLLNVNQSNVPSSSPTFWAVIATAGGPGPAGEFVFSGVWSTLTTYALNDIVSYNGSSYAATGTPLLGIPPTTDTAHWALIASVGNPGATGPQGVQGPIGLGFTWQGAWSALTSYHLNDVVGLLGNSYVATTANTDVNPSTDLTGTWQLMASAGTAGQQAPVFQTGGVTLTVQNLVNFVGVGMTITQGSNGQLIFTATGTAPVTSVFGRTGAVVAASGDYSAFYDAIGAAAAAQTAAISAAAASAASLYVPKVSTSGIGLTDTSSTGITISELGSGNLTINGPGGAQIQMISAGNISITPGGVTTAVISNPRLNGPVYDGGNMPGVSGQVLTSIGSGAVWTNPTSNLQGAAGDPPSVPSDNHIATGNNAVLPGAGHSSSVGVTVTLSGAAAYSALNTYAVQITRIQQYAGTGNLYVQTISGTQFTVFSTDPDETTSLFWTCFGKNSGD
jgi:hypothetical protein